MSFVLVLVSSDKPLSAGHLAGIERFIEIEGINQKSDPKWLYENKAAEISICECLNISQMERLREALLTDKIDVFCMQENGRKKKLLLADMDSTIVEGETLDELAEFANVKDKVADITARAMNGEIDYRESLKERVALLKGLSEDCLLKTLSSIKLNEGAKTLVKTMNANGAVCVLVSSGFTFFTGAIANKAGFAKHHGNNLEIKNGKITGQVEEPILDKHSKLSCLDGYIRKLNISRCESIAVGDGANDLPMLEAAGTGVGYHPKPVVMESVINNVIHGDFESLLYLQGYKRSDFRF